MGFFNTFLKTAVTWDSQYIASYEAASIFRGAVLELCKKDGFRAYLNRVGMSPKSIEADTDLSAGQMHSFDLEIDLKNNLKNLYLGMGQCESPILDKFRRGLISESKKNLHYQSWPIYRYDTSFDAYANIKSRIDQMLEEIEGKSDKQLHEVCIEDDHVGGVNDQSLVCPKCGKSDILRSSHQSAIGCGWIKCPTCNMNFQEG